MTTRPPLVRLLVVRHGQSTWNAERRWQGWSDPPLSPLGEKQATEAAVHLVGSGCTRVCSSDLQRAQRTAEILAAGLGLGEVVVDRDLRERNVGIFAGRTAEEIRSGWPECFDPVTGRLVAVPEGEDDDTLRRRASPALVRLAERYADDVLLVVSHGGVIRTLERHLGVDPPPATPNLGGRWFEVCAGRLRAGDPLLPVEPELVTAPPTE